jgi:uncharacterized protein (PEP-CTERM system associated)
MQSSARVDHAYGTMSAYYFYNVAVFPVQMRATPDSPGSQAGEPGSKKNCLRGDAFGMPSVCAIAACISMPVHADTKFDPSLSFATVYLDNLFLVPPGQHATSDWVGELMPRLQLSEQAPDLSAVLDYSAQGLMYKHDSDLNTIHQAGAGNLTWNPVVNLLFVDARAAYTQQMIDLTQPNNPQNLFGVGNVTNEFDAMVAPYLKRDFGGMTGQLRVSESLSDFSGGGINSDTGVLQNSRTDAVSGDLASDSKDAPVYWHFDGRSARTTFETAEPFRTDRVSAGVSEGLLPSLRLTQGLGVETNIETHSTSGGLNAAFWSVGAQWAWSKQTKVDASVGHRFFGPSYTLLWTHESRLLKYHVSYSEVATDASESTALTDFVPGQLTADPRAYSGVLRSIDTYDPYIAKQLDASLDLKLERTQLTLHVFDVHRHYINVNGLPTSDQPTTGEPTDVVPTGVADSSSGLEAIVIRDFGPRDQIRFNARGDVDDEVQGLRYRDYWYEAQYIRRLARTLQLSFDAVHFTRSGSQTYHANILQLQLKKSF